MEQTLEREQFAANLMRKGISRGDTVKHIAIRFGLSNRTARRIVSTAEQDLGSEFMSTGAPLSNGSDSIDCLIEARELFLLAKKSGVVSDTLRALTLVHKLQVEHDLNDGALQFETQWAAELKPF